MPARWIRVVPATALEDGLQAIRREAGVPEAFPADVLAEAQAAHAPERERVDLPFITIDPPGARDLDQAMHLERAGEGHRVRYAIADPGAFIAPGGALDRDTHARGVTVYAPDAKVPLHPPALSEGAASLLPGQWVPVVLRTLDLDARGELTGTMVERTQVRSVSQHTYEDLPDDTLLREIGERRLALERERGGVRLAVPEQEVVQEGEDWTIHFRAPLPSEDFNAQISLLTGMAAAALMLRARCGILRTQPAPGERDLARLRRQASALGHPWPDGMSYPEFVRTLDPTRPHDAALMHEATTVSHGAGYTAFDGEPPADPVHFAVAAPYAHATAPLRRLQDRYVSECCLAACQGTAPPDWVRARLAELPAAMAAGGGGAEAGGRGGVDPAGGGLLGGPRGGGLDAGGGGGKPRPPPRAP